MKYRSGFFLMLTVLVAASFTAGCHNKPLSSSRSGTPGLVTSKPARPASATNSEPSSKAAMTAGHPHTMANPPIDCPLRQQGIDPTHLRPFEDVEKYIKFLERPDREVWQKPDTIIAALKLQGMETVMDLGAGSGYFSFRFAKALPHGRVIAADIDPEMIRHIHHKAMTESVRNIEVKVIKASDPKVPDGVDLVFICDVLHHVSDRPAWLAKITRTMRSGARLVLVEFKEGDLPKGPPESMKIPRDKLVALATTAGLVLATEQADLLPYQTFLVFQKP